MIYYQKIIEEVPNSIRLIYLFYGGKMPTVNSSGYVERIIKSSRRGTAGKSIRKEWWIVMPIAKNQVCVAIGRVNFPQEMLGKRVRFRVEIID